MTAALEAPRPPAATTLPAPAPSELLCQPVRRLFAAFDECDRASIVSLLAEGVELTNEHDGTGAVGREQVADYLLEQATTCTRTSSLLRSCQGRWVSDRAGLVSVTVSQHCLHGDRASAATLVGVAVVALEEQAPRIRSFDLVWTEAAGAPAATFPLDAGGGAVGTRIRAERERQSLSLRGLARACGFSPALLSRVERGLCQPSVETLQRVAEALAMPLVISPGSGRAGTRARRLRISRDR